MPALTYSAASCSTSALGGQFHGCQPVNFHNHLISVAGTRAGNFLKDNAGDVGNEQTYAALPRELLAGLAQGPGLRR